MAKKRAKKKAKAKEKTWWKTALVWGVLLVGAREVYIALYTRRNKRRDLFNLAQHAAKTSGKPLIVVGDPDAGIVNRFLGRDYDCATLCIDKMGCLKCEDSVTGRLEDVLPGMDTNSAVIYVSATLEYVTDMVKVAEELDRVSGGDLYVVTVEPWTLTSGWYPSSNRTFKEAPPLQSRFVWKPHWLSPEPQTGTTDLVTYDLPRTKALMSGGRAA